MRASVLDSRSAPVEALVLLGVAGVLALTGNGGVAWMVAGLAALIAVATTFRQPTGRINHEEAAFLLAWLNAALDSLAASPRVEGAVSDADPPRPASAS